jgi:hypothetical protein
VRICIFGIRAPTKNHEAGLKIQKTLSEKKIPKRSFAYLQICFQGTEITALNSNFGGITLSMVTAGFWSFASRLLAGC